MAEFCMQIAGEVAAVTSLFESTPCYFESYLTGEPPKHFIAVTREALAQEQERLRAEARREGLKPRVFPDPFLERAVIQRRMAEALLPGGTVLLHGSTIAVDGGAYLFTADCGTGKSTHTRLWRELLGDRAKMVNDDKPFLKLTDHGVFACGSPWSGKHGLDSNIIVPLRGICILERGPENVIWPISPEEALPMLEKQSGEMVDPQLRETCRALIRRLAGTVPLWKMRCTKDPGAARAAYGAMTGSP